MTTRHSSDCLQENQSLDHPQTEPAGESRSFPWSTPMPSLAALASSRKASAKLTDCELLTQLSTLVKQEQGLNVAVLVHLAEVERRELHLAHGFPSLFAYCAKRLGFSEDVAYKRVGASRYGRRFPLALDLLSQGALHLSALMLVGPHLTDANHREWLTAAAGKSKREVELLVAARCPKPGVPPPVRKLPSRQVPDPSNDEAAAAYEQQAQACPSSSVTAVNLTQSSRGDETQIEGESETKTALSGDSDARPTNATQTAIALDTDARPTNATRCALAGESQSRSSCARAADRSRVQPLSGSTYRVVFTASEVLKQKLDRARELCSHSVAPGDLPALVERALDLLIEREEKRRYAVPSPKSKDTKSKSEIRAANSPEPRNHPDLDPVVSVEQAKRAPDPVEPVKTNKGILEAVEAAEQDIVALHPIRSVASETSQTAPLACSRKQGQAFLELSSVSRQRQESFEPFSVREFSRHVPAAVRRAVWERDGGQCTFVDDEGNRCAARHFLDIDHVDAYARGGPTAIANCRLLCRAHNLHRAKLTFGTDFMVRSRSRPRVR